jgi:hypothetical protein
MKFYKYYHIFYHLSINNFFAKSQNATSGTGDLWPDISSFFSDGTGDGRTFHFTLKINNNASII